MTTTLISFDGTEGAEVTVLQPSTREELRDLIASHDRLAVRGSGLSYCLASAATGVPSVSMRGLNRIVGVDAAAGSITVEPGVTIGAMIRHLVDRGLWFPVLPGHPEISVGGCVAFNTHGKTQHDIGQFSDHVMSLTLMHPDKGTLVCSSEENPQLFELTLGGMGLTGWIVEVTLRISALAGPSLERRAHRTTDLVDAVETMERLDNEAAHLYSWNDGNARRERFGAGVVYEEQFRNTAERSLRRFRGLHSEKRGRWVPVPLWNRVTTTIVNRAFHELAARRRPHTMAVLDAAFPINGKEGYFDAYSRRGLHEYQFIVPRDRWENTVERVRELIDDTGACIPLTSLKLFRGEPKHLWFRGNGVCLTLDGPATERTRRLFTGLDELAIEMGAPVNLSKDSRLGADAASRIFAGYPGFVSALREHDPARRIDSELRRRIDV